MIFNFICDCFGGDVKSVNEFLYCKLSLCVVTLMLAACGGGESGTENSTTPVVKTYAEPTQDVADVNTLGYFDYDANSNRRVIRNDLTGNFEAMLQFGQSHVVDPNGNESKKNAASDDGKRSAIVSYAN